MTTAGNAKLREEFIVCYAAGYPDPYRVDTLEQARSFANRHRFNRSLQQRVTPIIKRRWVSDYEEVV